jgi:hypothetical protein
MQRISSYSTESAWLWLSAMALFAFVGCNDAPDARTFSDEDDVENIDPIETHDHASAPHDGLYAVFGAEKYHGEIVFHEESGELTVYILGPDAQTPHPITEEHVAVYMDIPGGEHLELSLPASPDTGDPDGTSSRFHLTQADVPEQVHMAESVTIIATIDGEEFEGAVIQGEHAHDHSHVHDAGDSESESHDHDHAEDDHAHAHDEATEESSDVEGETPNQ